jgi:hypothetical protein
MIQRINAHEVALSVLTSFDRQYTPMCNIASDPRSAIDLKIDPLRQGFIISYSTEKSGFFSMCGTVPPVTDMDRVFFTFIGQAAANHLGEQELLNFTVSPVTQKKKAAATHSRSNRKLFKSIAGFNYRKKQALAISEQIASLETLLENSSMEMTPENTKLIFQVLSEITERAKSALNPQELKEMIESMASLKILQAEEKISKRKAAFQKVSSEIEELNEIVEDCLSHVNQTVIDEMEFAANASAKALEKLMKGMLLGKDVAHFATVGGKGSIRGSIVLGVICGIEFVSYVIFICVRSKQTKNFKMD